MCLAFTITLVKLNWLWRYAFRLMQPISAIIPNLQPWYRTFTRINSGLVKTVNIQIILHTTTYAAELSITVPSAKKLLSVVRRWTRLDECCEKVIQWLDVSMFCSFPSSHFEDGDLFFWRGWFCESFWAAILQKNLILIITVALTQSVLWAWCATSHTYTVELL